jgi:hypothetical protein
LRPNSAAYRIFVFVSEKHSRSAERKKASRAPLGLLLAADPGAERGCGQTDTK